jgi:hypothetical protein
MLWETNIQLFKVLGIQSYLVYSCCNEPTEYTYRGAIDILRDYKKALPLISPEKRKIIEERIAGPYNQNKLQALLESL